MGWDLWSVRGTQYITEFKKINGRISYFNQNKIVDTTIKVKVPIEEPHEEVKY